MIPIFNATSQKKIIRARLKIVLIKYSNDLGKFSFSVFNSNFIVKVYAEGT